MSEDQRYELYRTEYYRHQSMHEKNLINQDNAMVRVISYHCCFGR